VIAHPLSGAASPFEPSFQRAPHGLDAHQYASWRVCPKRVVPEPPRYDSREIVDAWTAGRDAVVQLHRHLRRPRGATVQRGQRQRDGGNELQPSRALHAFILGETFFSYNGAATVRDRWRHTDLGSFSGSSTATFVPSDGVVMLKVTGTP
jgi:hypothetical protein